MSTLDEIVDEIQDSALEAVEHTLMAADWASERSEDGVIHCATVTRWGECGGMFVWREEPAALHFSLTLDLRCPPTRQAAISELLRKVNERLWLGHFEYWTDDGVAVFRHTIPMLDRVAPESGEIAALLTAGVDAAEQFLPAFNFVAWGGKSAEEAIASVLFETVGEA